MSVDLNKPLNTMKLDTCSIYSIGYVAAITTKRKIYYSVVNF